MTKYDSKTNNIPISCTLFSAKELMLSMAADS